MSERVPAEDIERIVGVRRHPTIHWGRAVSEEQRTYILHPYECLELFDDDLAQCPWALAQDRGIDAEQWPEDVAVEVRVRDGQLVPA